MGKRIGWALGLAAVVAYHPTVAHACGGFFCGRLPVDQTAERIVFKVNPDSVTMITQIAYAGSAPDFAWVLPLGEVPDVASLAVFPQRALTALDANTGPLFTPPSECQRFEQAPTFGNSGGGDAGALDGAASGVTVHYRAEVGPYDVAAIESTDPMALYDWLVANEFNVSDVMLPYIEAYTAEGMKFLALKLQKDADTSDIQPFRFDLPGTTPSIPLRMTALAAEPEMGVVVFVFGDDRYSGANWPSIDIADDKIVWKGFWPVRTNWSSLVARGVDEAGGQGWVTELAGSTADLVSLLDNSFFSTTEDEEAGTQLRALIGDSPYLSRLYSRLSAEEMTNDPLFHRDSGGDVAREHLLSRYVDGVDLCPDLPVSSDPCVFTTCGAGGICRPVMSTSSGGGTTTMIAGCGCLGGSTARTTFDPSSVSLQADGSAAPAAMVVCQDVRMSFMNPGDMGSDGVTLTDPCLTFDCGAHGECLAMNMTPTCVCDRGYVAVGSFDGSGNRVTACEKPMAEVPESFYAQRLPELPSELPGGRKSEVSTDLPVVQPSMDDLSSTGGALPSDKPASDPQDNADAGTNNASGDDSGGLCSVRPAFTASAAYTHLFALGLALGVLGLRRRRTRRSAR